MNHVDKLLFSKIIEKIQTNFHNDNSVILMFKSANTLFIKDERVQLAKTADKRTLENRLLRLQANQKISTFEKQGDGKTYKVLLSTKGRTKRNRKVASLF